jgi:uncharacterized protein YecT (DUF1311 family)
MRPAKLLALATAVLGAVHLPNSTSASERCGHSLSTAMQIRCLEMALNTADQQLVKAFRAVASEAISVSGGSYKALWKENLEGFYRTSSDPKQQAMAFRSARRSACAFAKSVGFQGTGYGISTLSCELELTEVMLNQLVTQ